MEITKHANTDIVLNAFMNHIVIGMKSVSIICVKKILVPLDYLLLWQSGLARQVAEKVILDQIVVLDHEVIEVLAVVLNQEDIKVQVVVLDQEGIEVLVVVLDQEDIKVQVLALDQEDIEVLLVVLDQEGIVVLVVALDQEGIKDLVVVPDQEDIEVLVLVPDQDEEKREELKVMEEKQVLENEIPGLFSYFLHAMYRFFEMQAHYMQWSQLGYT